MGRANYQFRDTQRSNQRVMNPIWRGVGFVILVALFVGGYWLAGYLLELNWQQPFLPFPVPREFSIFIHRSLPELPGKVVVQVVAAILVDIVAYTVMVVVYGLINPIRPGKTDAPQPRGGRRNRSLTR
jgi:hypothetical protein